MSNSSTLFIFLPVDEPHYITLSFNSLPGIVKIAFSNFLTISPVYDCFDTQKPTIPGYMTNKYTKKQ